MKDSTRNEIDWRFDMCLLCKSISNWLVVTEECHICEEAITTAYDDGLDTAKLLVLLTVHKD